MDEMNNDENIVKYPPKSNPPNGVTTINKIHEKFNKQNASLMPNLEDFNQMFRQYADGLLNTNQSIFPPGHPLFNREKSFSLLKEANDKLLKENLELKKQLDSKTKDNSHSSF
tara:strand:+ start:1097 stop:1435 length:339 start_codon:yes stop_codon:yes gene_type:complete